MTALSRGLKATPRVGLGKALLIALPMILLTAFHTPLKFLMMTGVSTLLIVAAVAVWIAFCVVFVLMVRTGKTDRLRSMSFIALAFALPFYFIPSMIKEYGTVMLSEEMICRGDVRFCPLTMPMMILPALVKGVVVFPGPLSVGAGWFLLWIGASLSVGRGWCSWGCFFGGWDEFFGRVRKKAAIKRIDRTWIYLSFAVLLAIVLPLLAKKRVQCALFCPFGAMQSFFIKINIFEVRIDLAKCSQCKRCIRECMTLSVNESSLQSGKMLMNCTKCGQCIDACPKQAISYHIKGTPIGVRADVARLLFLYPAYTLFTLLAGNIVTVGLWRILNLATTGSMI